MNVIPPFSTRILKLLQSNTIMTIKQLRHELGRRSRSSFYRDLVQVDIISSYTHTGQYHALRSTAKFDVDGLWFFQASGFSKYGTLKNTLTQMVAHSESGLTHKELKNLLRIKVQNALTDLIKLNTIRREIMPDRIFVYLSVDMGKAKDQSQRRLVIHQKRVSALDLPTASIRIEILLELIRMPNRLVDEKVLGFRLRKRRISIQDSEVAYVLAHYDIKKNRF